MRIFRRQKGKPLPSPTAPVTRLLAPNSGFEQEKPDWTRPALTDFFSQVIYGDDSDSVVRKLLNGEVEAAAVGSSAFENLDEKTQSRLRIFQEQGSVPTGVLCIRSSISSSDRAIIEEAFLTTNADNPNLVRRVFGERLAKPEKGHLDLTRETLEAIKTVKP